MATQKIGPFGPFSGKLGKVIGYVDKNGKQRLRTIGEHHFENPSDKCLQSRFFVNQISISNSVYTGQMIFGNIK